MSERFIFATGIENSYPTVPDGQGGRRRVDEMELTCHYKNWRRDFELTKSLGICDLRYGPPYYRTHVGPGRYDWSFADETFAALKELEIRPIVDLCHFGVPDWIGDFQNCDWPQYFAEYARAFAARYPWINFYTPVNEIYTTALYSGWKGWWNEALATEKGFVRALTNLCKANVLAMQAIREIRPNATFIQSEASQYYYARTAEARDSAYFLNEVRFLSLDLTYGYPMTAQMYRFLLDNGMTADEYDWFQSQAIRAYCIMGTDYYADNENLVEPDGSFKSAGPVLGYYAICSQYYQRYHLPVMLTETNVYADEAVDWLWRTWANVYRLLEEDIPVVGFTWYSLVDQVDWDSGLRQPNNRDDSLGLFDLDRRIRPVGEAYRELIEGWQDAIPTQTAALRHLRW